MPEKSLQNFITEAMRAAMRAKQKERLGAIRLVLAEIKKVEVDERIVPDDARVISILDKMVKQRKDSFKQFADAGRDELAAGHRPRMAARESDGRHVPSAGSRRGDTSSGAPSSSWTRCIAM